MSIFDASVGHILLGAVALGAVVGVGSVWMTPQGRADVAASGQALAVKTGLKRLRDPQPGDSWGGCTSARAAGTAPIYRGEPGYRSEMDGDDDGVACEDFSSNSDSDSGSTFRTGSWGGHHRRRRH